jgi:hypothetical protein
MQTKKPGVAYEKGKSNPPEDGMWKLKHVRVI